MTAVATLAKGYDAMYYVAQVGEQAQRGGEYYTSAVSHGEPPGIWLGRAAERLGFEPGQRVENEPYLKLLNERQAPDGSKLGRRPSGGAKAHEVYEQLLAAEPHADASRRRELRITAQQQVRQSPLYFDLTISPSKSISVFLASLGENARQARERGDAAAEAFWAGEIDAVHAMFGDANRAALEYFEDHAAYIRTGNHASRLDGRAGGGEWHKAEFAVASFVQHTSRGQGDAQLHVQNVIAHTAYAPGIGRWGAPDSAGYGEFVRAAGQIAALHFESALKARYPGMEFVPRADGNGGEIAGIGEDLIRAFSSRREAIEVRAARLAREFETAYGRQPSQRELRSLRQQANLATREHKPDGVIDWDERHLSWAATARHAGVDLASVARQAWGHEGPRGASGGGPEPGLDPARVALIAREALERVQAERATFTRADLVAGIGRAMPRTGIDPAAVVALVEELADRALRSDFEPVVCLEAPSLIEVPVSLQREDGRALWDRPGNIRYATEAQLMLEEQLVQLASAESAPAIPRELAAELLGATVEELEAALAGAVGATRDQLTRNGYRLDQAAVAFHVATSGRMVDVINAAAGAGKTTTLFLCARLWEQAGMGPVVGVTPSQASRNTLAQGIADSYNSAQFLGHMRGQRGARGAIRVPEGALAAGDEASMLSTPDMADTVLHLSGAGGKVIMAGDEHQLQAVESGGAMGLLIRSLGYLHLVEPQRFSARWERDASVRVRSGDIGALADYWQHGRIRGGEPENIAEDAAKAYIALTLEGKDALLMAQTNELRRELSRRIRGDLQHLGLVSRGDSVPIADGQEASAGDVVVCRENFDRYGVGEGRTMANGDLYLVEAVRDRRMRLRRMLDADPQTGQRRYSAVSFDYLHGTGRFELGYAVTAHAAQSRTVHTGIAVVTGEETRETAYVMLTRGAQSNMVYVFTLSPRIADPRPGPVPAPELARFERITSERDGRAAGGRGNDDRALGVLADVLQREGAELSALAYQARQLSQADHLGELNAILQTVICGLRAERYRAIVAANLPAGYHSADLETPTARWLYRSLRAAELAGLSPDQVVRDAIEARTLTGARDVAAVLDTRIRKAVEGTVPQPVGSFAAAIPDRGDPDRRSVAHAVAELMDQRRARIGEHLADTRPAWTARLGPVPDDPVGRLAWTERAAAVGAYRELYGYTDQALAIGPEPGPGEPDKRALWHAADQALGPGHRMDLSRETDGRLALMASSWNAEVAWAPRDVSQVLAHVRTTLVDSSMATARSEAEAVAARASGDALLAGRHQALAASHRLKETLATVQEGILGRAAMDREEWEHATAHQRAARRCRAPGAAQPPPRRPARAPALGRAAGGHGRRACRAGDGRAARLADRPTGWAPAARRPDSGPGIADAPGRRPGS